MYRDIDIQNALFDEYLILKEKEQLRLNYLT